MDHIKYLNATSPAIGLSERRSSCLDPIALKRTLAAARIASGAFALSRAFACTAHAAPSAAPDGVSNARSRCRMGRVVLACQTPASEGDVGASEKMILCAWSADWRKTCRPGSGRATAWDQGRSAKPGLICCGASQAQAPLPKQISGGASAMEAVFVRSADRRRRSFGARSSARAGRERAQGHPGRGGRLRRPRAFPPARPG